MVGLPPSKLEDLYPYILLRVKQASVRSEKHEEIETGILSGQSS
jgi:hypothetical protein